MKFPKEMLLLLKFAYLMKITLTTVQNENSIGTALEIIFPYAPCCAPTTSKEESSSIKIGEDSSFFNHEYRYNIARNSMNGSVRAGFILSEHR